MVFYFLIIIKTWFNIGIASLRTRHVRSVSSVLKLYVSPRRVPLWQRM
jgi:hypothetical protein